MIKIEIDEERCNGCNFCVDFCPTSVFDLIEVGGQKVARAARPEECWACLTCAGQCPEQAITITQSLPEKRYVDDFVEFTERYAPTSRIGLEAMGFL